MAGHFLHAVNRPLGLEPSTRLVAQIDGTDRTGPITVPNTGGWQTWTTLTKTDVSLSAGTHVFRVVIDTNGTTGSVGNLNWFAVR
jgi:hypothetical protein